MAPVGGEAEAVAVVVSADLDVPHAAARRVERPQQRAVPRARGQEPRVVRELEVQQRSLGVRPQRRRVGAGEAATATRCSSRAPRASGPAGRRTRCPRRGRRSCGGEAAARPAARAGPTRGSSRLPRSRTPAPRPRSTRGASSGAGAPPAARVVACRRARTGRGRRRTRRATRAAPRRGRARPPAPGRGAARRVGPPTPAPRGRAGRPPTRCRTRASAAEGRGSPAAGRAGRGGGPRAASNGPRPPSFPPRATTGGRPDRGCPAREGPGSRSAPDR